MGLFKKNFDNYNKYARLFPAKIQNRILLEAVSKISGPKLVDYLQHLNKDEAKEFFNKYPDIKARLNNPLKNKIYPSLLKKAAFLTPVFWFGMLPKHEQAKYFQKIKENLPWNKRKTQKIKTQTELKSSGVKEVKFGLGQQKVVSSTNNTYSYKGISFDASSREEAVAICAGIQTFSDGMNHIITSGLFDDLKLKQDNVQETLLLNSLCRLRGDKLDKVFAEIDVKELNRVLEKHPEYKNKIPKRLAFLCENNELCV